MKYFISRRLEKGYDNFYSFEGNNWGKCDDGSGAVGCGPQETFRGCADVEIVSHPLLSSVRSDSIDDSQRLV